MSALESALDFVREYLAGGGFVMAPLLAAAAVLWYAIGYRALTLFAGNVVGRARALGAEIGRSGVGPLRDHLDAAFGDLEDDLGRHATVVRAIVIVAPLTGLLGTVAGMMETFDALGEMALFAQSGGIAGGISQALLSTQMGLAVAIPGLLVGRMLQRRQDRLLEVLEQVKDGLCARAQMPAALVGGAA